MSQNPTPATPSLKLETVITEVAHYDPLYFPSDANPIPVRRAVRLTFNYDARDNHIFLVADTSSIEVRPNDRIVIHSEANVFQWLNSNGKLKGILTPISSLYKEIVPTIGPCFSCSRGGHSGVPLETSQVPENLTMINAEEEEDCLQTGTGGDALLVSNPHTCRLRIIGQGFFEYSRTEGVNDIYEVGKSYLVPIAASMMVQATCVDTFEFPFGETRHFIFKEDVESNEERTLRFLVEQREKLMEVLGGIHGFDALTSFAHKVELLEKIVPELNDRWSLKAFDEGVNALLDDARQDSNPYTPSDFGKYNLWELGWNHARVLNAYKVLADASETVGNYPFYWSNLEVVKNKQDDVTHVELTKAVRELKKMSPYEPSETSSPTEGNDASTETVTSDASDTVESSQ